MSNEREYKYLTEGIVLAGLSILSYLGTFAYQAGYAIHFNIPLQLITIDLTTILVSFAVLLAIPFFLHNTFNLVWMLTPKENDPISLSKRRFIKIVLLSLVMVTPFMHKWLAWVIFFTGVAFIACLEFLFPLIHHRDKGTYSEKLAAQNEIEYEAGKHLLWHEVDKRLGRWVVTTALYVNIAIFFAFSVGMQRAELKQSYYTTNDSSVVLAIYDDLAVISKYDCKTLTLSGDMSFEKIGTDITKTFRLEKIGKLKLTNDKEPNTYEP